MLHVCTSQYKRYLYLHGKHVLKATAANGITHLGMIHLLFYFIFIFILFWVVWYTLMLSTHS